MQDNVMKGFTFESSCVDVAVDRKKIGTQQGQIVTLTIGEDERHKELRSPSSSGFMHLGGQRQQAVGGCPQRSCRPGLASARSISTGSMFRRPGDAKQEIVVDSPYAHGRADSAQATLRELQMTPKTSSETKVIFFNVSSALS